MPKGIAMSSQAAAATGTTQKFRSPRTVVARFVGKSVSKGATIIGYITGAYVAASILGYISAYPTEASRQTLVATFGSNVGLQALFGVARNIDTVRGFTAWRCLGVITILGAIWALLAATKRFRGEEEQGRWELLLSGQTTSRGAALNTLAGLGAGLFVAYALTAIITGVAGQLKGQNFGASETLFFSLALVASSGIFFAVGALVSQIAPTRRRAAGISAGIFALAFLLRAIADAAPGVHWLNYISPLGWIEQMRPLTGSSPIWLLPIVGFIAVACYLTVHIAGRRDLGTSLIPDKDTAEPRTKRLNTPLGLALREVKGPLISWLVGISAGSLAMGFVAKSAGEALAASPSFQDYIHRLVPGQVTALGAVTYLGIVFLTVIIVILAMAASFIGAMREDEAKGYLDNLFTRPVARLRWLGGRLALVVSAVILTGLASGIFAWLATASQHTGIPFASMLNAGVNAMFPAAFIVGVGMLAFGLKPRWTSWAMYAVIGWSFLLEMIGPAVKLNHWVLDTSLVHHIAYSPATTPRWGANVIILGIGIALAAVGAWAFNRRDIVGE